MSKFNTFLGKWDLISRLTSLVDSQQAVITPTGAVVDEVERPLPRIHQLVLLLAVVPKSVGDHLKI